MSNQTFIIAEAGVNHNGRLDLAYELCDAAKAAGVDAVKFQTWKTEKLITKNTQKAEYQTVNTGADESQYDMLKRLELSYQSFLDIKKYCDQIGIQFLSTAAENESLDFLLDLGMPCIKIGSGEVRNIPYLRYLKSKNIPVIIGTGMSYISEVERAYRILSNEYTRDDITVLHCTTNYPCPMEEVNLKAMLTIKQAFNCRVGYSDHTMGIEIPIAAVAMGAEVIEKHFTLDRTMEGPDHKASLEPSEMKSMVDAIRNIEQALGDGIKRPNASEIRISTVVTKRIVASKVIVKGDVFSEDNLSIKRSSDGIPATEWDLVIGRISNSDYEIDDPINI